MLEGKPKKIGKKAKRIPSVEVKMNSKAVRDGRIRFNNDGLVGRNSQAVNTGDLLLTADGRIDGRSRLVKNRHVLLKKKKDT